MSVEYIESEEEYLDTIYGPVTLALINEERVSFYMGAPKAHVNDTRETVKYRGDEYIGSVTVKKGLQGAWVVEGFHLSRRSNWTDAPPTYARAIVDACIASLQVFVSAKPGALKEASRRQLTRDIYINAKDCERNNQEIAILEEKHRELVLRGIELRERLESYDS